MSIGSAALVFCLGGERWLRAQAVEEFKRRCVGAGFEETDFVRFSDPSLEPQQILEAARTAPFGSSLRLVVVEGIEELEPKEVPWLTEYLAHPNPQSCVMVCADQAGRYRDFIPAELQRSGRVQIVWCLPLKGSELENWIRQRAQQRGKRLDGKAVSLLMTRIGSDLQALDLALESLGLLVGDSPEVTPADVEALIAPSLRETAFDILDLAASGQVGKALEALHQASALNRVVPEQFLGALGWYYRRRGNYRIQRWPASKLQEVLEELLGAEVRIKQGHPAPKLLADQLLLRLGQATGES